MKTDITPNDSVCPIFLEPANPAQVEADKIEAEAQAKTQIERAKQKQRVLDRLGITADEAALLFG